MAPHPIILIFPKISKAEWDIFEDGLDSMSTAFLSNKKDLFLVSDLPGGALTSYKVLQKKCIFLKICKKKVPEKSLNLHFCPELENASGSRCGTSYG